MADRDQVLAEFQAFTGIDDFGHSLAVLEQHDWNLMEAVQNTMAGMDSPHEPIVILDVDPPPPSYSQVTHGFEPPPIHSVSGPTGFSSLTEGVIGRQLIRENVFQSDSAIETDGGGASGASASAFMASFPTSASSIGYSGFPSTSSDSGFTPIRLLTFKIEHRDRTLNVVVPDNEKVEKLKELIRVETQIPVDEQRLCGWVTKSDRQVQDEDVLRDLKLRKETTLYLIGPGLPSRGAANGDSTEVAERLSQNFQLIIKHKDNGKVYPLNFSGVKTIREVKDDIYSIIDVPVRHQVWSGWPPNVQNDDTMTLAGSGVSYPCHNLEVSSGSNHIDSVPAVVDVSSEDEFEDAQYGMEDEEVLFDADLPISKKQTPLMPDNASNQSEALESFVREFSVRYGENHPVFYIGSLEDALKDSLQCRARERKLLAVYLHHDNSIQANVFCSQILCSDAVVNYLSTHFIIWGWDLTLEPNRARLLSMCTKHFGSVAANTVRNFKPDELPLLLIISRNRLSNEVVQVIRGNTSVDELVPQLMNCVEVFQHQLTADIQEEDERNAREAIKQEQEDAYEESLIMDRAKAETRKNKEQEQRKIEEAQMESIKKEDEIRQMEEQQKEAIRRSVADTLPDEPPENCSEPTSTIRFRCPGGELIVRRFLAQHPLQVLLNFVTSKGYHIDEFKVLTTFPRKDLTLLESQKTLKELNLFPQETLMLEEK